MQIEPRIEPNIETGIETLIEPRHGRCLLSSPPLHRP